MLLGRDMASTESPADPKPFKWRRVLGALYDGRSLNRFQAERDLRDHCLNTTIAGLEARGIRIDREDERVPGAFGVVHCKRYKLALGSRERAAALLEQR